MSEKFVLNDHFKEIISLFEKSSKNIFITGKACTGKSSLIIHLKKNTKKNLVLLAPTAIAALNINAKTIHSFFNFPFHIITKSDIKKHYNDDFAEVDMRIQACIKENQNGLVLLHGKPGTGKTSYLKNLVKNSKAVSETKI